MSNSRKTNAEITADILNFFRKWDSDIALSAKEIIKEAQIDAPYPVVVSLLLQLSVRGELTRTFLKNLEMTVYCMPAFSARQMYKTPDYPSVWRILHRSGTCIATCDRELYARLITDLLNKEH